MQKCENCGKMFDGQGEFYDLRPISAFGGCGYVCSKRCAREMEDAARAEQAKRDADLKEKGVGGILKEGAKKDFGIIYYAFAGIGWILKKLIPMVFKAVFYIIFLLGKGIYKGLSRFYENNDCGSTEEVEEVMEIEDNDN